MQLTYKGFSINLKSPKFLDKNWGKMILLFGFLLSLYSGTAEAADFVPLSAIKGNHFDRFTGNQWPTYDTINSDERFVYIQNASIRLNGDYFHNITLNEFDSIGFPAVNISFKVYKSERFRELILLY